MATVYAVREATSKVRLSYRFRDWREARNIKRQMESRGAQNLEVYRTSQDLPRLVRRG